MSSSERNEAAARQPCGARGLILALAIACLRVAGVGQACAEPAENAAAYYYDRLLVDRDLDNTSAVYLRLLRNTIYAKAGRPFKDPVVRAYFEAQNWYRPRPEGAAKLSAIDEANLRSIRRWEAKRAAEQVEHFNSKFSELVPRGAAGDRDRAPRADCEADARGVLGNRKDEDKLVALAARLRWPRQPLGLGVPHQDVAWDALDKPERAVRLACLPDLDGDGISEAVVAVLYPFRQDPAPAPRTPLPRRAS